VAVAQLVEHRIVAPKVAGSSPVGHPHKTAAKTGKARALEPSSGANLHQRYIT
jgi:hypothetical protein